MAGETPKKTGSIKSFNCTSCGSPINIRAMGFSTVASCGACQAVIDLNDPTFKILQKAKENKHQEPLIPIGKRGKILGVLWEVIGFMERCDQSHEFFWREYLLFNPANGFRWLTEFDGHWNYVVSTKQKPIVDLRTSFAGKSQSCAKINNGTYVLFHSGNAIVWYVVGEFYWKVKVGETVVVADYIAPPEILSCESTNEETIWSIGQYIEPDVVKKAFEITENFPTPNGVAPNQPSTMSQTAGKIGRYWLTFLGVIIILQVIHFVMSPSKKVIEEVVNFNRMMPSQPFVSGPFELSKSQNSVEYLLYSPITNTWLENQVELVNDVNGESFDFEHGVEYYEGYDSDGTWREGSRESEKTIYEIPKGTYHLNILPEWDRVMALAQNQVDPSMGFKIRVIENKPLWGNFFWAVAFLSIFPLVLQWRKRSFELERWSNSDFSPYWKANLGGDYDVD